MKEESFITRGSISSLEVIPKRELDDLLYEESESEVEFFKKLRLHDFWFALLGKVVLRRLNKKGENAF